MRIKKLKHNPLLIILIAIIILLILILLFEISCITIDTDEKHLALITTLTSLIMVAITSINIICSNENNKKILEQNIEDRFIQLRYKESKKAIFELEEYLYLTLKVYSDLKHLFKNNVFEKIYYITPHEFLILRFVDLISKRKLLTNLPTNISSPLQGKFEEKITHDTIYSTNNQLIKKIEKEKSIKFKTSFNYEYSKCLKNYLSDPEILMKNNVLNRYLSSHIDEIELLKHFINILNKITSYKTEDIILKDKNAEILPAKHEQIFEEIFEEK